MPIWANKRLVHKDSNFKLKLSWQRQPRLVCNNGDIGGAEEQYEQLGLHIAPFLRSKTDDEEENKVT